MESGEDCCVKVAVHVRPLIGDERLQGCKDCVTVVPGKPQVRLVSECEKHSSVGRNVRGDQWLTQLVSMAQLI